MGFTTLPDEKRGVHALRRRSSGAARVGADSPFNGIGLALDNHEQHARRAFGSLTFLFPIAQRSGRDPESGRECRLRQLELASDAADIDIGGHVHAITRTIGFTARDRDRILEPGRNFIE